jgi:hypothetical protein
MLGTVQLTYPRCSGWMMPFLIPDWRTGLYQGGGDSEGAGRAAPELCALAEVLPLEGCRAVPSGGEEAAVEGLGRGGAWRMIVLREARRMT